MSSFKILLCSCSVFVVPVRVKTSAVDNFLGLEVTKVNKFQTKITLKVVPESTKIAYI